MSGASEIIDNCQLTIHNSQLPESLDVRSQNHQVPTRRPHRRTDAAGPLVVAALTDNLTVNPIQAATLRTGKTAMILLVLSMACTPANTVFGFTQAIRVRRALGLYAFLYAAVHFSIFFGIDYGFDVGLIWLELADKRYILVGAAALLILIPLAVTSTKGWQRRLKKTWKQLISGFTLLASW